MCIDPTASLCMHLYVHLHLHTPCTLRAHCMLRVRCVYAARALHLHCVLTACALRVLVHCMCTAHTQVEMMLKLIGHGCSDYWADGWNKLDGSIVLMHARMSRVPAVLAAP